MLHGSKQADGHRASTQHLRNHVLPEDASDCCNKMMVSIRISTAALQCERTVPFKYMHAVLITFRQVLVRYQSSEFLATLHAALEQEMGKEGLLILIASPSHLMTKLQGSSVGF